MALKSYAFKDDPQLNACLRDDSAHLKQGATGLAVRKIQAALHALDGAIIVQTEIDREIYGPSTAAAVLAYKTRRKIINHSRQSHADDVVGKMTIESLDNELQTAHLVPKEVPIHRCKKNSKPARQSTDGDGGYAGALTRYQIDALGKIA